MTYAWITIWAAITIWVWIIYFDMYHSHKAEKDSYTCQALLHQRKMF